VLLRLGKQRLQQSTGTCSRAEEEGVLIEAAMASDAGLVHGRRRVSCSCSSPTHACHPAVQHCTVLYWLHATFCAAPLTSSQWLPLPCTARRAPGNEPVVA